MASDFTKGDYVAVLEGEPRRVASVGRIVLTPGDAGLEAGEYGVTREQPPDPGVWRASPDQLAVIPDPTWPYGLLRLAKLLHRLGELED